jgi:hypothetical protein
MNNYQPLTGPDSGLFPSPTAVIMMNTIESS